MKVELKHHFGWESYEIQDAVNLVDAAYKAIRKTHTFLTDTNHYFEQSTSISKNIPNSILIFRDGDAPKYTGPAGLETPYWFAVKYSQCTNEVE